MDSYLAVGLRERLSPGKRFLWANAKRKLKAAGFLIRQDGDREGTALFDPDDACQARLAIRLIRARRSRKGLKLSPAFLETGKRFQFSPGHGAGRARTELETTIAAG